MDDLAALLGMIGVEGDRDIALSCLVEGVGRQRHDASIDATPSAVPGRASSVKPRDDRDRDQGDRGQHKHSIRPLHDRPPLATRSIAVFRSASTHLWSAALDVGGWLRSLGLDQYEANFRDNKIDADVLPQLTADDLKDIGVSAVGDANISV